MAEAGRPRVAVFTSAWGRPHDEVGFVARSLAGALSRVAAVDVLLPGPPGPRAGDGAFDPVAVGEPDREGARWPSAAAAAVPPSRADAAVLDRPTPALRALVDAALPAATVVTLAGGPEETGSGAVGDHSLLVGTAPGSAGAAAEGPAHPVGLHVAVNPLAATQRHGGLGFTGYVLVLSDRPGAATEGRPGPTPPAAWLAARFTQSVTVVIEDGVASVWQRRSLLGRITVATRMDLWRLVSHAAVTVDLSPGPLVARECVESLRFGVPVVVPAGSAGHRLAAAGGGLWYRDVAELLGCVEALLEPGLRQALADQGRVAADAWYGRPDEFVARVAAALAAVTGDRLPAPPPRR